MASLFLSFLIFKYLSIDTSSNQRTISDNRAKKIFGTREGHVIDTPSNRATMERVANNENAFIGSDKFNNQWYAENQADGRQVWVQVRNGAIWNGGVNETPRTYNPKTGLCPTEKPSNK